MYDVAMLLMNDWSNTGYRYLKCFQHLGINAIALKGVYHPFAYPEQIPVHPVLSKVAAEKKGFFVPELKQLAENSSVLHFTCSTVIDTGVDLFNKKVVMQHGGSVYRNHHAMINKSYNPFVDTTIIQTADLLGFGAVNEQWVMLIVDTDYLRPCYKRSTLGRVVVGHFSRGEDKGTNLIKQVFLNYQSHRIEYRTSNTDRDGVYAWQASINRMAGCDVIVETLSPVVDGVRYGGWSNTALEAAALGKIVITNDLRKHFYEQEFGACALRIANTPEELTLHLQEISDLSDKELFHEKQRTRAWVESSHSIPASAARLWEKVYQHLL